MQPSAVANTTNLTASPSQFYSWQNYRCVYEVHQPINTTSQGIPLPYESTAEFIAAIAPFINEVS